MDIEAINPSTYSGPVLANWHCDKVLWQQYLNSEGFDAAVRSAKLLFVLPVIATPLILAATFLAYGFGYLPSYLSTWLVVAVALVGGVLALTGLILWPSRHNQATAMRTETGEVTIALYGFSINGQRFDWIFGPRKIQFKGAVWRFQNCRRKSISDLQGLSFEVLEFEFEKTSLKLRGTGGAENTTLTHLLPIPSDKISEADAVASRLNLRFESAKREWEGSD